MSPLMAVLDRNPNNLVLLGRILAEEGVEIVGSGSLEAFEHSLAEHPEADLALVDLAGLDSRIWEACDRLHQKEIPFLLVAPHVNAAAQSLGLAHGARMVLPKPLSIQAFKATLRTMKQG